MTRRYACIAAAIWCGSVGDFTFYGHGPGFVASFLWAAAAAGAIAYAAPRIPRRVAVRLAVAGVVVSIALFVALYPRLDTKMAEHGSDRDDGPDIAVRAAAHLDYPFDKTTYLGNPITHLPGSLIVAAPFVGAGGVALQNVAVLPLAAAVLIRRTKRAETIVVGCGVLACSTFYWHEFITGGNSISEWFIVIAVGLWALQRPTWRRIAALGFAFNFRTNAWCAGAGVTGAAIRGRGVARGVGVSLGLAAVQAVLIGPFLLGGMDRFGPLSGIGPKFDHLDALVAHGSTFVPALAFACGAVAAGIVGFRVINPIVGLPASFAASQAVQFSLLALCSYLAGSTGYGRDYAGYLWLAVVPAAVALAAHAEASQDRMHPWGKQT